MKLLLKWQWFFIQFLSLECKKKYPASLRSWDNSTYASSPTSFHLGDNSTFKLQFTTFLKF
jgi:hypothetical protein